ncbi:EAL domain-containing protein [Halarcobacter sp.]|uniref:EAL domain-containing protein n=1 Tax=Halarcobacter sp. TaxID=2321133 RepID=UPI0029F4A3ED|nr:EAL domain-containing protein [Halarcobacter sp.]
MRFSLSKFNFLNLVISTLLFSIITGIFVYKFADDFYDDRVETYENNYINSNKDLIKNEIEKVIKRAEALKELQYANNKLVLKEKIDYIQRVLSKKYSSKQNIEKIINETKPTLDYYKWDNNTGYIYIFDKKGKILYHGTNKNLISKNVLDIAKDNSEFVSFLQQTLSKDENYGSYFWNKPLTNKNELFEKYVYIKYNEELKIYIAAGVYKDEMDKKTINTFLNELEVNRFGENDYGYFWVLNTKATILMHPIDTELEKRDLTNLKSFDNKMFIQEIIKRAKKDVTGYITYHWNRPDTLQVDEKTSYFYYIKDWNIIINSGFYLAELKKFLSDEKMKLKDSLIEYSEKVLSILIILTIFSILIAKFISSRIEKIEDEKNENYNLLEQYKMILDHTSVVSRADINGKIHYVNDNFEKISGFKKEVLINNSYSILKHPDNNKKQYKELWQTIKAGNIWKGLIKNRRKNGESYYNKTTIFPIRDSNGKIVEFISSSTDVTELLENRTKLNDLFKNDPLTGLGNRVSLINKLATVDEGVLALINIDRFKEINDSYSHEIGDEVIKTFANRLFDFFSDKNCILYRVQADIFAIYYPYQDIEVLKELVEKFMKEKGKEAYYVEKNKFIVTYTCGLATNKENLLTFADIALSEAKNKKIRIAVYNSSMKSVEQFKNNILWVDKLYKALSEDRIIAHYQPIYNYQTKKIEKYEALMRLIEDDKIIYPNEYLSIAKKTRLYPELTYKMVEKVISKFSTIEKEFSLNLCVEDLMNDELMSFIFDFAQQKKVFNKMVLEIVESEEIEDSEHITKLLKRFKDKGCKIAIDDFGSGYSNYDYLIKLQVDYIKIDGSIIKHILDDTKTQNLVKSIVSFAKKSDIKVIAEFVSSKEIDSLLKELNVDYAQGFYYGKPSKDLICHL